MFQKGHKKVENSGRRAGTPNKKTADIKALAFQSAPDAITELVRLLKHSQNEAVRVSAAKELLDRAIGKAVQPHSGEDGTGPVLVQVYTGVPRADDFDISSPRIISRDESLTTRVF